MGVFKDFFDFLQEYKIVGLAIAFVVGAAANSLIKAFVEDVIMPSITPFIPDGAWKTATFSLGPIIISWGDFLSQIINFLIIALTIFIVISVIPKKIEKNKKILLRQKKIFLRRKKEFLKKAQN